MKKKLIIGGVIIVIILVIFFLLLTSGKNKKTEVTNLISPTPVELTNNQQYQDIPNQNIPILQNYEAINGVETDSFVINYSTSKNKYIISEKTPDAKERFREWANLNNYPELIDNSTLISFQPNNKTLKDKHNNPGILIDFLSLMVNYSASVSSNLQNLKISPSALAPPKNQTNTPISGSSTKVYFSQCGEYGNNSLPSGCTICKAGCGPTTISMIGASYVDSNINPQTIVDLYRDRGYLLGCDGSRYTDAKSAAESLGLKTTSFMIYSYETADQVASDFKNYINDGWTIFTLANFCQGGCGHFFWITEVDSSGNLWAYDPYYGRFSAPPLNENAKYPYPLYRVAFGVKK